MTKVVSFKLDDEVTRIFSTEMKIHCEREFQVGVGQKFGGGAYGSVCFALKINGYLDFHDGWDIEVGDRYNCLCLKNIKIFIGSQSQDEIQHKVGQVFKETNAQLQFGKEQYSGVLPLYSFSITESKGEIDCWILLPLAIATLEDMFTGILAYDWSKLSSGSEYRSTMCRKLMFWCLKTGLMALSGFQQRGLIHRDYKAANILILNGSHLIGDFGLARNVIGYNKTVFPETQLACYLPIDMATHAQFSQIDVWSLGYLLVTQWLSLVYGIPTPEQFNTLGNLHKEFLAWLGTTMSTIKQNPFYLPSDEPVLNVFLRMTVLDSNCRPTAKDFLSQDSWIHNIVDNPTADLIALFDNLVLIEAKNLNNGEAVHTKQKNVLEWFEIMNKTIASLSPDHNPRKIHPRKITYDRRYNIVQVMFSIQRDAAISFKYLSQILGQTYTVTLTNEVKFKRDLAAREELKLQQQQMQQQVYLQQQQAIDQGIKQQLQEQLKYFYDNRTAQYQQQSSSHPQSVGGALSAGGSSNSSGQSTSLPGHSHSLPATLNHANSAAQPASSTLQSIQQQQQSLLLMQQQQQVQSNQQLLQPLSHSSSMQQVQPQQPTQLPPLTHNSSSLLYGKPMSDPNAGFSALSHHNSQSLLPPSQPTQQPTQIPQQQTQPMRLSPIEQQLSQIQLAQQPQTGHQALRPISPREQPQFQHSLSGHLNAGFTAQHSMDAQQHHSNSLLTPQAHTQLQNNSAQYSQHNFPPPSHTQLQQLQPLPQGQSTQPQLLQPSQSQTGQLLTPSSSQQQQQQQHLQREKMLHQMQHQQQQQQQQLHQLQQQLHIPSSQSNQQPAPQSVPKHANSQMQFSSAPHGQYPTTPPQHMMPLSNSQGSSHQQGHGQPLQQPSHQQQPGPSQHNQAGQLMHPQIPQMPPQQQPPPQQSYQPLIPQQKLLDVNPLGYNTGWS